MRCLVYVKNGGVVKIEEDPECITNKGTLCPKGLASIELLYHPARPRYPMKRVGKRGEVETNYLEWSLRNHITLIEGNHRKLWTWTNFKDAGKLVEVQTTLFDRFYNALGALATSGNYYYGPRIMVSKITCGYRLPSYGLSGVYPIYNVLDLEKLFT